MTTLAQRLDDDDLDLVVECAVNRVFAELERSGSDRWPIVDMHAFLQRDSRFPKLGYLDCQLTFDFLLAIKDEIEGVLHERLADALRDQLADKGLQVLPGSIDPGKSFHDQVQSVVLLALNGLFPDGKITPAAEPLFWQALSLVAYENGSKDVERVKVWVKHQLGWDAPPPDPPPSPSPPSSPPRAATVVPFKRPKRRAKKGRKAAISV
jgi:hypothetical protein